jgi:hypothetical protein
MFEDLDWEDKELGQRAPDLIEIGAQEELADFFEHNRQVNWMNVSQRTKRKFFGMNTEWVPL